MQPFDIISSVSKKQFSSIMVKQSYRQPIAIFRAVGGLLLIIVGICSALDLLPVTSSTTFIIFTIVCGLAMLAGPLIILLFIPKLYDSPRLRGEQQYTFSDDGILCRNEGLSETLPWNIITRMEEINGFIVLSSGKGVVVMNKQSFSPDQLQDLRDKVVIQRPAMA